MFLIGFITGLLVSLLVLGVVYFLCLYEYTGGRD